MGTVLNVSVSGIRCRDAPGASLEPGLGNLQLLQKGKLEMEMEMQEMKMEMSFQPKKKDGDGDGED